ncbi:uncharacterized protein LOC126904841 isoform X4 [Daktulosphaira vitifoliae]|uniref:uncharacterized protein LOC126904841 isoform X3 n=1 Tax=Daktulosphaira vitifoliae TaxID=58002 RepID=UPI0021A991F7|nr:uncharacterized protein LOC126904841 isoform X3 [Daktulosphaira vitifoliae]XP_050540089.1 uncharacterized protein LOC126904841 isoform X4 [Daktulosphaira vitifoliae]
MVFIKSLISCTFVIMFHEFNSMANSREDLIQEATYKIKLTNILLEKANNNKDLKNQFIMALNYFTQYNKEHSTWAKFIFPCRGNRLPYETDEHLNDRLKHEKMLQDHLFTKLNKEGLPEIDVSKLSYNDEIEKRFALIKALVEDMLEKEYNETKLCVNRSVVKCALKAYLDYIKNPLILEQFAYCENSVCTVDQYALENDDDEIYDSNYHNLLKKYTIHDSNKHEDPNKATPSKWYNNCFKRAK